MSSAPGPRTLLAQRLHAQRWTIDEFVRQFNRAGRHSGPDRRDHVISRRQATRWAAGRLASLPHPASCRVLESMFDTAAEALLAPPGRAFADTAGRADGLTADRSRGDDEDLAPDEEVRTADRRDLLATGLLLTTGATALGPADQAVRISRAIAEAGPDPLTLAQLQEGMQQLTTRYDITPRTELVAPVERAWLTAEALLETRITGPARADLELAAGRYAFYRGRLAFDLGDEHASLIYFVLAGQHADAAGDSLLRGSVAAMRSALAFFAGDFPAAAAIARAAQPGVHPYVAPTLASSLARALAQTGDPDGALDALQAMRDTLWTSGPLPGVRHADEETFEAFSAVTLGYLGRGEEAETHARTSLALLSDSGGYVQIAGTHLALARALLRRRKPDPEQAAAALHAALAATQGSGHSRTASRAAGIHRHLTSHPDWSRLPAVRDLTSQLSPHTLFPATDV
jgi:hypothetical protein